MYSLLLERMCICVCTTGKLVVVGVLSATLPNVLLSWWLMAPTQPVAC